jgi:hypothetical protein
MAKPAVNFAAPHPPAPLVRSPSAPTFSVVIAAYQAADCVAEAIASVLAQTSPPHEIVVCDDGSTDDLAGALAPFAGQLILLRQANAGEAAAKNAAARAASGEFVAILDADDTYLPERLAAIGELAAARPDLDLITTDAYLEHDGEILRRVYTDAWPFAVESQRRAILERNFIFGHVAVRRKVLLGAGGFDESIRRTTDWECWTRLILGGASVGAVLEPLSRYRVRPSSLSADRIGMLEGGVQSLRSALRHPQITATERIVAAGTINRLELRLAPLRLNEAIRTGAPGVRRQAAAVAGRRDLPLSTRVKAAAAVLFPRAAARVLTRRRDQAWVGAGGTRIDRA